MFGTPGCETLFWLFACTWMITGHSAKGAKCNSALGMKNKGIPDGSIQASSSLSERHVPNFARLDNRVAAWCPHPGDESPYIQVTFKEEKLVTGISTQGSRVDMSWARKYVIEYMDESSWVSYNQVLRGNRNVNSRRRNPLKPPITTRAIRIYPKDPIVLMAGPTAAVVPCLRLELYGCSVHASCPDPGVPSDGLRISHDFRHGKTVTFQCNHNYSLAGNVAINCNDGVWSGNLPQCKAPCPDPGIPSNGRRLGDDFLHMKTVTFQCNHNYSLAGNHSMNCNDGVWSSKLPQCKASCDAINSPRNGKVHSNDTQHGAVVSFSCIDGFELQGSRQVKCVEGRWNGTSPMCKAPCPDPGEPLNGRRLGNDFHHGKAVTFQCDPYYSLAGNEAISCSDGAWSGNLPQCKAPCPDPGVPSGGRRLSNDFRHGETVTFQCNHSYVLAGNDAISCSSGVWSGNLPQCKAPCSDPGVPSNGSRRGDDFRHMKTVTFQCNHNYVLAGNDAISCSAGVWSGNLPQCIAPCPDPGVPSNGERVSNDFRHGKTVKFLCNHNYILAGNDAINCSAGVWDGNLPQCKVQCPRTNSAPLRNCVKSCSSAKDCLLNQKCLCDGDCGLSCVSNELQCERPPRGPDLERTVSNGRYFGSLATYSCRGSFILYGSSKRTCRATGRWDGKKASCSLADRKCLDMLQGVPRNLPNNTWATINDRFSFAKYGCHKGFMLVGNEIRSCRNGRWRETNEPQCKEDYSSCGASPVDFRARIVGGNHSQRGWWPWHVGLYKMNRDGTFKLQCGGTLISSRWVLTAAGCVSVPLLKFFNKSRDPREYKIRAGDHRLDTLEDTQQEIFAEKIVDHYGFNYENFSNDIALIKLQKPVELGKFVRTACLPSKAEGDLAIPGKYGYVAGWGDTIMGENSNVLQYSSFPIQSNLRCTESTIYSFFPTVMFCAGDGRGKSDPCKGDAGGAFVREGKRGRGYRWVTTGIVSWGEGCAQRHKYGYYTRVYPFIDWIKKIMDES